MKALIRIRQDLMQETDTWYDIVISDTIYRDRVFFSNMHMQWVPYSKTWEKSGSISRTIEQTEEILRKFLEKNLSPLQYVLEIEKQ